MSGDIALDLRDCEPVDFGAEWGARYPVLLRRARYLTANSSHDAEDLLSQATVKVLNYLSQDRELENFIGLMLVSLLQVHLDSRRHLPNRIFDGAVEYFDDRSQPDDDGAFPCVERCLIAKQTLGDIFDHLASFPSVYRELFRLRFVEEMAFSEISKRLGISEVNARQKTRKLRLKLQAWMGK